MKEINQDKVSPPKPNYKQDEEVMEIEGYDKKWEDKGCRRENDRKDGEKELAEERKKGKIVDINVEA